jgi:hypothetical protein
MKANWSILAAALLVGCVHIPAQQASVECVCHAGTTPVHRISLHAATGNWAFSGHGLGFYREISWLSIRLPEMPTTQARYEAAQVSILDESPSPPVPITVTDGHVLIDQKRKEVTVSFQTSSGPFWANGTYPMR